MGLIIRAILKVGLERCLTRPQRRRSMTVMTLSSIEFRTQTSTRGERVFTVQQERPNTFSLNEAETRKEPTLFAADERGPGVYEVAIERTATPTEAAMLANAAFQSIAVFENNIANRNTDIFALVGTSDLLAAHEHANLYDKGLGMAAVALTRQGDEIIMLGGDAQEVSGNAAWTLHDANIYRVTT